MPTTLEKAFSKRAYQMVVLRLTTDNGDFRFWVLAWSERNAESEYNVINTTMMTTTAATTATEVPPKIG